MLHDLEKRHNHLNLTLFTDQNRKVTYCAQVTVGSGKPSASQANKTNLPTSAVALTSDILARMVGSTKKKQTNMLDVQF